MAELNPYYKTDEGENNSDENKDTASDDSEETNLKLFYANKDFWVPSRAPSPDSEKEIDLAIQLKGSKIALELLE
jgi:hypothetical protein